MASTVSLPRRDAEELRGLVGRAITAADRLDQQGKPVSHQHYQALLRLYGALDRALTSRPSLTVLPSGGDQT